jgi:hypothetical protein
MMAALAKDAMRMKTFEGYDAQQTFILLLDLLSACSSTKLAFPFFKIMENLCVNAETRKLLTNTPRFCSMVRDALELCQNERPRILHLLIFMWKLIINEEDNQRLFGNTPNFLAVVMSILETYRVDNYDEGLEKGCLVLWSLCGCEENRLKLSSHPQIFEFLQGVLILRCKNAKTMGHVLGVISLLADKNKWNQQRFLALPNLVDLLSTYLDINQKNGVIIKLICRTFTALCRDNIDSINTIGTSIHQSLNLLWDLPYSLSDNNVDLVKALLDLTFELTWGNGVANETQEIQEPPG